MQHLDPQPALIDRAYEQLVEAIADGTLAPGQRIRQEELGRALGVSRQPISHALQLLKQQKLVEETRDNEDVNEGAGESAEFLWTKSWPTPAVTVPDADRASR